MQFHIGTGQSVQKPEQQDHAVVNTDGSITLRWVCPRLMNGSGKVFLLDMGAAAIPFDTDWSDQSDQDGKYYLTKFDSFGDSPMGRHIAGLQPHIFSTPEDRRSAQILAVEALLVYGEHFDGFLFPDGRWRVDFEGHHWRLSDFGYDNKSEVKYV